MEDLLKHRENRRKDLSDMYALIYGAGNGIFDGATSTKSPKPVHRLPFNLDLALKGYKVVDEDNRPVRVVCKLAGQTCRVAPVLAICTIPFSDGDGEVARHFTVDGSSSTKQLYMLAELAPVKPTPL